MNELAVFDEITATLAKYKAENDSLVFAYDTPEGEKQARSHIAKLRKAKTIISDIHKEAKADALAFGRKLDSKKRELTGEVDSMVARHKDPLDAIEAEKQAVIDAEKARLEEEEAKRQAELEAREAAVREAEERIAAEKTRVDRTEREKRIAKEAAENARVRAEAEAKAKAESVELTRIRATELAEAAEEKRIANKKHRKQIEDEIHLALTETGQLDNIGASMILEALKESKIPHVTINY